MKKNPVTKIAVANVDLSNGIAFKIYHQLTEAEFGWCMDKWTRVARRYTADDFCAFVKQFHPKDMCVTEEVYERLTKGKVEDATEEEYLAENN